MPPQYELSGNHQPSAINTETIQTTPAQTDTLFSCLANRQRRVLLDYIAEKTGPVFQEEAVHHVRENGNRENEEASHTADEVAVSLVHVHLPKLQDAGIVEVDSETSAIETGELFDVAESILDEA